MDEQKLEKPHTGFGKKMGSSKDKTWLRFNTRTL